jgi:hypothetical protein
MDIFWLSTSRQEKNLILSEIIKKLHISQEEKELYLLSIGILDDHEFQEFYTKIVNQVNGRYSSIEPFSTQLI